MSSMHAIPSSSAAGLQFAALTLAATPAHPTPGDPAAMSAKLSEWKVELSQPTITAGIVIFTVTNTGSVPHAFEVEGQGIEEETKVIQPGSSATLKLTLKPGNYLHLPGLPRSIPRVSSHGDHSRAIGAMERKRGVPDSPLVITECTVRRGLGQGQRMAPARARAVR